MDLMELVLRKCEGVAKDAADELGLHPSDISRLRSKDPKKRRHPNASHLVRAMERTGISLAYFQSETPPETLEQALRVAARDAEDQTPVLETLSLGELVKTNPAVKRYLDTADGDGTPLGIAVQLALTDWKRLGVSGEPTHDQIHRLRSELQRIVRESLGA